MSDSDRPAVAAGRAVTVLRVLGLVLVLVLGHVVGGALVARVPAGAAEADPFINLERVDAGSFVDAGVGVSRLAFPGGGASTAVLATTANFPDGLASTVLAGRQNGTVLFTEPDGLPPATAAELSRILVPGSSVFLMGGTAAVSEAVREQVEALGFRARRVAGPTRVETAVEAARLVGLPPDGTVLIARAFGGPAGSVQDRTTGWVDSTSCGGYGAMAGTPVLLSETGRLSSPTAAALAALGARRAVVCGGTAAISDAVLGELQARGLEVVRVSGPTRVLTAESVARRLFGYATAGGRSFLVVNGYDQNFGYGFAAAALAAKRAAPILYVNAGEPTSCEDASQPSRFTLCYLATAGADTARVTVVGSAALVGTGVADAAAQAAGGRRVPPLAAPTDATVADDINDDGTRLTVRWNAVADPDAVLSGYRVYIGTGGQAGTRLGGPTTVGRSETSFVVTALQPGVEYTVAVTAVDTLARETARSNSASAIPVNEVPAAVTGFVAEPGDNRVGLRWASSPEPDVTAYRLQRATAVPISGCGTGASYGALATVQGRGSGTYEDTTAANGTAYCYRIEAVDTAGQAAPAAQAGPVEPSPTTTSVTLLEPKTPTSVFDDIPVVGGLLEPGLTLHTGAAQPIRYRVASAGVPPENLTVRVDLSTDGGSTYPLEQRIFEGPQGTEAERTISWTVPDFTPLAGETSRGGYRIRVTVLGGQNPSSDNSNDFTVDRRPSAVRDLAATPAPGAITLRWTPNPETTVAGYEIRRRQVSVLPGQEPSISACTSPLQMAPWDPIGEVTGRTTVTYTDAGLTRSDTTAFCYRVAAIRLLAGGGRLTSPDTDPAVARPGSP
jgi:putative cell wall-binding protein